MFVHEEKHVGGGEGTPSAVTASPGGLLCIVFHWKLDLLVAAMHKAASLWHRPIMFLSAGNDVGALLLNKDPTRLYRGVKRRASKKTWMEGGVTREWKKKSGKEREEAKTRRE